MDDDWMRWAQCGDADPEIFFPDRRYSNEYNEAVITYCNNCPVQAECEQWGADADFGIWAGQLHLPPPARERAPRKKYPYDPTRVTDRDRRAERSRLARLAKKQSATTDVVAQLSIEG